MPTDLPPNLYHEPEIFQREREAIFSRHWHMLGRADQLAEPGQYVCANIGGYPLFALVDDAGRLGGFRNTCLHQKLPLLDNGAGECDELRCRYHGWTYGLDGVLVHAPPTVAPDDLGTATYALARVPVAVWHGRLVLVHPAADAVPAGEALAGIDASALEALPPSASRSWSVNANWKLVLDGILAGFGATAAEECAGGFAMESEGRRLAWAWPTFGIELGDGWAAVWQVIPRTFRRTEFAVHAFSGTDALPLALEERAERAKGTAESAQSDFDDAKAEPPYAGHPALSAFHARILDALGMAAAA